jgi:NADH:ubiquinone oxidoreductase subunit 2 (chain N)
VTAYLSVGSKAAGFVVLLRVLHPFLMLSQIQRLLVLIALLTLIYGNLAALPQGNLKRLLAYSSIAHAGYLLIGVVCLDGRAVVFYLALFTNDAVEFCCPGDRIAANRRSDFGLRWIRKALAISRLSPC